MRRRKRDQQTISYNMSQIKSKGTSIEKSMETALKAADIKVTCTPKTVPIFVIESGTTIGGRSVSC